jgi:hypothetical protein
MIRKVCVGWTDRGKTGILCEIKPHGKRGAYGKTDCRKSLAVGNSAGGKSPENPKQLSDFG